MGTNPVSSGSNKAQPGTADNRHGILKGYMLSLLLAIGIGVAGGAFEALVLWPRFEIVTLTAGPDVVFLIANTIAIVISPHKRVTIGIAMGFVNVVVTAMVSFYCFVWLADGGLF